MLECKLSKRANGVNDNNKSKNKGDQKKKDGKQKTRSAKEGNRAKQEATNHNKRNTNENNVERDTKRNREPRKEETLANSRKSTRCKE
jgi:hypothetical protein